MVASWMQLAPCRLVVRCLRHPILSLTGRQQRKYLSERNSSGVQQTSPAQTGASGAAPGGVTEGMNGSNMDSSADRLIWVDLEMTGLEVDTDHIMEMACIITDGDMNIVAKGPDLIVHHPDSVLDAMGPWCKEHHGKSGLTEACRSSKLSLTELEDKMLTFVQQHTPKGTCPLAGNTVHVDKRFLDKYMKRFSAHLHYRIVDVSSIKELCKRWYPTITPPRKKNKHRALDDILESITELKFYRENIFR